MTPSRPDVWTRDFRRLRRLALDVAEQADHFERNTAAGSDDTIRSLIVSPLTREMDRLGRRLARRWRKERAERAEKGGGAE